MRKFSETCYYMALESVSSLFTKSSRCVTFLLTKQLIYLSNLNCDVTYMYVSLILKQSSWMLSHVLLSKTFVT